MRGRLGKLLLALASAVATLVVFDLVLLAVHGPVRTVENFYVPDAQCGYVHRPNLTFEFASPYHGYRATVHTNGRGLRGPDFAVPKPPGIFRVLLIGDSMTAGLEVDEEDTFAAVCARELSKTRRVEVLNGGVRGYNIDNVLGFLRSAVVEDEPDVVVYVFTENDVQSTASFAPETADISRGWTLRGVSGRLAARSHLLYRLELLRQQRALRRAGDRQPDTGPTVRIPGGLVAFFTRPADDPALDPTTARLAEMANLCAAHGARFVLAGAPHRQEIEPASQAWWRSHLPGGLDFDGVRRYLDHAAGAIGATRLDPVPAFRARLERDGTYWFHRDDHLDVRGHRLMGELLARGIESLPEWRPDLGAGGTRR